MTEPLPSPQEIKFISIIQEGRTSNFNCNKAQESQYQIKDPELTFCKHVRDKFLRGNLQCMSWSRDQTRGATVGKWKEMMANMAKAPGLQAACSPICSLQLKGLQGLIWLTSSSSTKTKLWKWMSTCGYFKQKRNHASLWNCACCFSNWYETDSLGLELNAKAIWKQFREHASIFKVLRWAKQKHNKVEKLVKNGKSSKYLRHAKWQFLPTWRIFLQSMNYELQLWT